MPWDVMGHRTWEACAFASWAMLPMSSVERWRQSALRPWVLRRGQNFEYGRVTEESEKAAEGNKGH